MNSKLESYARQKIKEGLLKLSEGHQMKFKRMYSHKNLDLPIDGVVDDMPKEKLDWALTQVQNSLDKISNVLVKGNNE